jgi:hypothetical protein
MWGAWRSSGKREKEGRGGCVYGWSGVHCIGWRLGYIGLSWTGWEEEYEYGWSPIQAARPKSIMMHWRGIPTLIYWGTPNFKRYGNQAGYAPQDVQHITQDDG